MRTDNLHKKSYEIFRFYLDAVYKKNTSKPIIPLSLGYPLPGVFPLPSEALKRLSPIDEFGTEKHRPGYGWEAGSHSLRESIINYENQRHLTHYDLTNICMTAGGSYALNRVLEQIFLSRYDKKQEFIISCPTFYRMLQRSDEYAIVKNMLTQRKNLFQPTLENLIQIVSPNTKAVFICNPSNPGYNYINASDLYKIIDFLNDRKIYLIIDEVGDNFFHSGMFKYSKSIQSSNIIRICSSSKTFQLAEYRLGYVIGDKSFIGDKKQGFVKLIGDDIGNPPLAANEAWKYMLDQEIDWIKMDRGSPSTEYQIQTKANEEELKKKCKIVIEYLSKSAHVTDIIAPSSSFNLTFQFKSDLIKTDVDFFINLLKKKSVSLVPCSGFGFRKEEKYMRLTFAVPDSELIEGLKRIVSYLDCIN